jgi:hypothetical protein
MDVRLLPFNTAINDPAGAKRPTVTGRWYD